MLVRSSVTRGRRAAGVQLAVADVEGDDLAGAALQQAVGEAAGRRPDVERRSPVDVDAEAVEGGVELLAAAPDEPRRRAGDDDRVTGGDQAGRLVGDRTVDEHPPVVDRWLGLAAAGGEAPPHELGVESPAAALISAAGARGATLRTSPTALLRRAFLASSSWPRDFLAGDFFASLLGVDFFAPVFLAVDFLAPPSSPATSSPLFCRRLLRRRLVVPRPSARPGGAAEDPPWLDVERLELSSTSVDPLGQPPELLGDLRCTIGAIRSVVSRPPIDIVCTVAWLGVAAADLARLDETLDDRLGLLAGHLGELRARVEQLLEWSAWPWSVPNCIRNGAPE